MSAGLRDKLLLWIAQGFGIGRIPFAPGTFGSVLGVLWFVLLVLSGSVWVLAGGIIAGVAASVWLCGEAERILGKTDPGCVVLDEIIAIPICFLTWTALAAPGTALPPAAFFFEQGTWPITAGVFLAFRFFDILKPWPVRQSQSLHGGWGVTIDDVLAAVYVNVVFAAAALFWPIPRQ